MAKLAGISAEVQASINEIQNAFDHDKEQVNEFKAIDGEASKALDKGLSEELNFNKEGHKVASDSNITLHRATQVLTGFFLMRSIHNFLQNDTPDFHCICFHLLTFYFV